MNFEDWQELWQKQPLPPPPDAAAVEALLRRVRADARTFDRNIFSRDLREIGAAIMLFAIFACDAWTLTLRGAPAWNIVFTWIAAAAPLGVGSFLLVDRLHARRLRPRRMGTVLSEIDRALAELRHQHQLLMNVAWWYLLPIAISSVLIGVQPIVAAGPATPAGLRLIASMVAILAVINYPLWWLNRRCARKELAPQIEQLERERRDLSPPDSSSADPS